MRISPAAIRCPHCQSWLGAMIVLEAAVGLLVIAALVWVALAVSGASDGASDPGDVKAAAARIEAAYAHANHGRTICADTNLPGLTAAGAKPPPAIEREITAQVRRLAVDPAAADLVDDVSPRAIAEQIVADC